MAPLHAQGGAQGEGGSPHRRRPLSSRVFEGLRRPRLLRRAAPPPARALVGAGAPGPLRQRAGFSRSPRSCEEGANLSIWSLHKSVWGRGGWRQCRCLVEGGWGVGAGHALACRRVPLANRIYGATQCPRRTHRGRSTCSTSQRVWHLTLWPASACFALMPPPPSHSAVAVVDLSLHLQSTLKDPPAPSTSPPVLYDRASHLQGLPRAPSAPGSLR